MFLSTFSPYSLSHSYLTVTVSLLTFSLFLFFSIFLFTCLTGSNFSRPCAILCAASHTYTRAFPIEHVNPLRAAWQRPLDLIKPDRPLISLSYNFRPGSRDTARSVCPDVFGTGISYYASVDNSRYGEYGWLSWPGRVEFTRIWEV